MAKVSEEKIEKAGEEKIKRCGIIMPISPNPEYPHDHWKDVLNIITEGINQTQFKPNLVSDDEAIGLIHERIVTNVYNNEIIVCDVSSKNPNVMFELGMRLAFDKPVIIIKDDKTSYTFDTGVIEHITYPSSLRFAEIVAFKTELAKRIDATYKKSIEIDNYSPFLRGFGKTIVPSKIQGQEVTETKYLIDQIFSLKDEMKRLRFDISNSSPSTPKSVNRNRLVSKYLGELMGQKKGGVNRKDLLDFVTDKLESPNMTKDDIQLLVDDYWDSITNK